MYTSMMEEGRQVLKNGREGRSKEGWERDGWGEREGRKGGCREGEERGL